MRTLEHVAIKHFIMTTENLHNIITFYGALLLTTTLNLHDINTLLINIIIIVRNVCNEDT